MAEMSIDELLRGYTPEVQALAGRACALITSVLPGATVKVHPGWKNVMFSTGPKMSDAVVAVVPLASRINFQLFGADLPDPAGLLEGTGKMGRHVKISSLALLESAEVRELLLAAAAIKAVPMDERQKKMPAPVAGFRAYASKTVNAPLDALFAAWTDEDARRRWLGSHPVTIRGTTPGKSLRARWGDMPVDVRFGSKSATKSTVTVDQRGIATGDEAAAIKAEWGAALERLKAQLA